MKEGWEVRKLGEVMVVERGGSPRPIKKYLTDDEDGINWIKISDATASNKYIYETKQKITADGLHKTRMVNPGDFILSNSMSFGRPYIMKTSGCIHDGWLVLRVKEDFELDKDFLYHLLCSPNLFSQFDNLAAGSTVRNLNIGLVKSVEILLPPLPEQKKIVRLLDRAFADIDAATANIERNLENARELFQSQLDRIFEKKSDGWVTENLISIGKTQTGLTPSTKKKEYYGNHIPFIKPAHFNVDGTIESGESMLSELGLKVGRLYPKNSILMVCIGATIGKTGYSTIPVSSNQQINALTPNKDFAAKIFYYGMITSRFQQQVIFNASQATLPIINKSKWEKLTVRFPVKKTEQESVITILDKMRFELIQVEKLYRQKLQNLNDLKKSLLQRAFAGELR